jgi:sugar lactone lactonase YvrE
MQKKLFLSIALSALLSSACSQKVLFKAEDFTAENLFTNNIEGPNFDKSGNLYVVNYQKDGTIAHVKPDGSCELFLTLPQGSTANAIQFDSQGAMYLADFSGHNVLKVDMKTKSVSVYCHNDAFNQPNDICITKNDVLFASDPNWKQSTGQIWRIDKGGKAVLLTKEMGTTNGICLSPDEKTLYVNESVQKKIWAFDLDATGNITNKRLFTSFEDGGLDGMKCDRKGNLYTTRWGLGKILVFSPKGQLLKEIYTKGKQTSNLVFSPDAKSVFVTLQDRKGMEKFSIK